MPNETIVANEREKQSAATSSVWAAVVLVSVKLVIGFVTGSLGILAEAAHSGLDLVAAFITFLAVRYSDRPADETHTYGHGKIESFSALVETILLLVTCIWIVYEGIQRLLLRPTQIDPSFWAFATMATSIFVDVNRSRMLYTVAHKYQSQALEADALHFSTDVWSSSVVIAGLTAVWLGQNAFPSYIELLNKADAVSALGVALIVTAVSYRLGKRTVDVLLDRTPEVGLARRVEKEITSVEGVVDCHKVRLRRSGQRVFVDMHVLIDEKTPLEAAHKIASSVEDRIRRLIPGADIVVHTEPSSTMSDDGDRPHPRDGRRTQRPREPHR